MFRILLYYTFIFLTFILPKTSWGKDDNSIILEQAIGRVVKYEFDKKLDLSIGTYSSSMPEVVKIYFDDIEPLPAKKRAIFLFMVDMEIQVHGGPNVFKFYELVVTCCDKEYEQIIKNNLDNRYLGKKEYLENSYYTFKDVRKRLEQHADASSKSKADYYKTIQKSIIDIYADGKGI